MKLSNAEDAIVELRKLEDYCLNPHHARGKHKARVFSSALGVTRSDARELREHILEGVLDADCMRGKSDAYGRRYIVDVPWQRKDRTATVRTVWIIKRKEAIPRLITCYVL